MERSNQIEWFPEKCVRLHDKPRNRTLFVLSFSDFCQTSMIKGPNLVNQSTKYLPGMIFNMIDVYSIPLSSSKASLHQNIDTFYTGLPVMIEAMTVLYKIMNFYQKKQFGNI